MSIISACGFGTGRLKSSERIVTDNARTQNFRKHLRVYSCCYLLPLPSAGQELSQHCSISSFAFWLLSLALSCFPCLFRLQPLNANFARFMVRTHRRFYPALSRYSNCCKDALDTGSNKSALLSCNKLLKKYPKNDLLKVRHIHLHRMHIQP